MRAVSKFSLRCSSFNASTNAFTSASSQYGLISLRFFSVYRIYASTFQKVMHAICFGALAQLGERNTGSVEVSGSIPLSSTKQETVAERRGFFVSESEDRPS